MRAGKTDQFHVDTAENFHPAECNGAGKCRHCDRRKDETHDPATCALCDPSYDYMPNPSWAGEVPATGLSGAAKLVAAQAAARPVLVFVIEQDDEMYGKLGRVEIRGDWSAYSVGLEDAHDAADAIGVEFVVEETDELQKRADEISAADRAADVNREEV